MRSRIQQVLLVLVIALVVGFSAARASSPDSQQESNRLPPIFAVGKTVQHGGAPAIRIAEVRGNWIREESRESAADVWYYVLTDGAWMAR